MNPDSSEELFRDAMTKVVDRVYGEHYATLFPDIEPPVETLDGLDVGDSLICSDEFIHMVMDSYIYEASLIGGAAYTPPRLINITENIRQEYEIELEELENEAEIEYGSSVAFSMDEESIIGVDIEFRVAEVLDALNLTYIQGEVVTFMNLNTMNIEQKTVNRIINTSTNNLFDFDFKNVLIDRSTKEYEESVRTGYNNLLRINLANIQ